MKSIFWLQLTLSSIVLTLNGVIGLFWDDFDAELNQAHLVLFLVCAGFLWLHSAITEKRAAA